MSVTREGVSVTIERVRRVYGVRISASGAFTIRIETRDSEVSLSGQHLFSVDDMGGDCLVMCESFSPKTEAILEEKGIEIEGCLTTEVTCG